jgi:hypothetical protein
MCGAAFITPTGRKSAFFPFGDYRKVKICTESQHKIQETDKDALR